MYYTIYVLYGWKNIHALDKKDYDKIDINDLDAYKFDSLKDGWNFMKSLKKSDLDYVILTLNEIRKIEAANNVSRIIKRRELKL